MSHYERKKVFAKYSEEAANWERQARQEEELCREAKSYALSLEAKGDEVGAKVAKRQAELHQRNAEHHFYVAKAQWEKAAGVAMGANLKWCESRAEVCEHRLKTLQKKNISGAVESSKSTTGNNTTGSGSVNRGHYAGLAS